jgi:hypothetical protein
MSSPRVALLGLAVTLAIFGATAVPTSASNLAAPARAVENINAVAPSPAIIPVAERKCPPFCPPFLKQHDRFHKRYDPKEPHFGDAHKNFHNFHRKPHRGPVIYFGWYIEATMIHSSTIHIPMIHITIGRPTTNGSVVAMPANCCVKTDIAI